MKKNNLKVWNAFLHCSRGKSLFLLAMALFGVMPDSLAQGQRREITGAEADQMIPGAYSIKEGRNTSYPRVVMLNPASSVSAQSFVPWFRKVMRTPEFVDFKLIKKETDNAGMEHYRYVQTFRQVPIDKAHYVVHTRGNKVISFGGLALNVPVHLSASPKINESQALTNALEKFGATEYKWQSDFWMNDLKKRTGDPNATYYPKGELCWSVGKDNQSFRLAWRFDIQASSPHKFQRIYIDANTGALIQTLPMESNCSGASTNTFFDGNQNFFTDKFTANDFRLRDDCAPPGSEIWIRDWNSTTTTPSAIEIQNTTNTWTTFDERFGASVLWLTGQAYAYWQNVHTRNSYNGTGGNVTGFVNAVFSCAGPGCTTTNNASMSFTGGNMLVGAGNGNPLNTYATIDIIGHEFTHAVTGATSQLAYQDESGALNESFSDIFGEMNELFTRGSNDWLLGGDRNVNPIRSMANPNAFGDPDTYGGTNWCDYTNNGLNCTANDAGGVHTNSGVQNFWFYLLSVGGSGTNDISNAYNVSGIGTAKASAIAYQTLLALGPNDNYSDARDESIAAAINLYGGCSNEVKQTTNAWYAVGVGNAYFDATPSVTSNYHGRHVSCFDECDGAVTVTVTSGVLPTYMWTGQGGPYFTQSVSNLCPGVYTVKVTNLAGLGCSVTKNVTIQNTPQLTAAPAATSNYNGYNISCKGEDDGKAAANAAGGTPPYSYSWSPGGSTEANPTGLSAGMYSVTVTDANGCQASGNVTLTEPPLLTTTASPTSNYNGYNVRCNGGSDGTAEAFPVGGVPPYSYSWNPSGQTTKVATNLSAIDYVATVTDANGCTASDNTGALTQPPPLTINAGSNKTVYYGYPDSACATLTATGIGGGVPPYTLSWSTGASTASINVCPTSSTNYTVTVTDLNGCTMSDVVRVCVIDVRCGNNLDKVELCHFTGSNNNPSNTLCVALSGAKNHIAHGDQLAACGTIKTCTDMARTILGRAPEPDAFLTAFPNPFGDYTTVRFKVPQDQHASIKLYDIAGRTIRLIYDDEAKSNTTYDLRLDGSSIPAGVYFLILKTNAGESYSLKLVITD